MVHEQADEAMPALPKPLPPDLLEGTAYVATARIASGGMGDVVEARHLRLGVRVVVKLLREEHLGDASVIERLALEGKVLAALDEHPHVVGIRDIGQTARGVPFLVLEPLRGTTLRDELYQRGYLPAHEAVLIVRQVLAALAAAHQQGFVHRDVKLDNVFVCRSGLLGEPKVKLLDFGIVKVLADRGAGARLQRQHATAEGMLLGTPRVLAPEQLDPSRVGPATDIYAVGLMLYTLVVGRGPFDHHRLRRDLLRAHREEPPIPPSVVGDRFPGAHAMGRALLGLPGCPTALHPITARPELLPLGDGARERHGGRAVDLAESVGATGSPTRLTAWPRWRRRRAALVLIAVLGMAVGVLVVGIFFRG